MSMLPIEEKDYSDGRTKQSFKDQCDINRILQRAQKTGTLSHIQKHGGEYGDFAEFDYTTAQQQLARAKSIFEELPSELRKEFGHNPAAFFEYVNDPANSGRLVELLPGLAKPGRQFLSPTRTAKSESSSAEPPPAEPAAKPSDSPSGGSEATE